MTIRSGYLINAAANTDSWNADCDYALWTVDRTTWSFLEKARAQFKEAAKKTAGLHRWYLFSSEVSFISRRAAEHIFGEEVVEDVQSGDPPCAITWDSAKLDGFDCTISDNLILGKDGFWWEAQPTHTDNVTVGTDYLTFAWFKRTCRFCGHAKEHHVAKKCLFGPTTFASIAPDPRSKAKSRRSHPHRNAMSKLR